MHCREKALVFRTFHRLFGVGNMELENYVIEAATALAAPAEVWLVRNNFNYDWSEEEWLFEGSCAKGPTPPEAHAVQPWRRDERRDHARRRPTRAAWGTWAVVIALSFLPTALTSAQGVWMPTSTSGAPTERSAHTAVWTSSRFGERRRP